MNRMEQPGEVSTLSIDISSKLRPVVDSRHLHFPVSTDLAVVVLVVLVVLVVVVADVVDHTVVSSSTGDSNPS